MIEKLLSPSSKELWFMLDYPEDWYFTDYTISVIYHKPTKLGLWVRNGPSYLNGYETSLISFDELLDIEIINYTKGIHIRKLDRFILWHKVKKLVKYLTPCNENIITIEELKDFTKTKFKR